MEWDKHDHPDYKRCSNASCQQRAAIDEARAEMIFREEQLHNFPRLVSDPWELRSKAMAAAYDAARDRYLALLAEQRIRNLKEVTA